MSKLELTLTKTIAAPVKAVFEAWLDPKTLAQFMRPDPSMAAAVVTNDPKEGGSYEVIMKAGEQELPHRGEYKVIDRYRTIVFTWVSAHTLPDSTVTLTFEEHGEGQTVLTLHHAGFPHAKSQSDHQGGWGNILDAVAVVVS